MLKIYITDTASYNPEHPSFSLYRKEKLKKAADTLHFMQSATAEALLCFAAKKEGVSLPLDIKTQKGGKPYADNINFSISHSDKKVLVAISDSDIGADIQKINPYQNLKAARKFLTPDEMENLDVNLFFKFFAMKESYFKMTGQGLPLSPVPFSDFDKCFFKTFEAEDYMISICSKSKINAEAEFVSQINLTVF